MSGIGVELRHGGSGGGGGGLTSPVANADLASMNQSTIKGRAAGAGSGAPQDLTATQATAILNAVVGDSGAGGTKGLVPAPAAGDAAAGKFLDAAGAYSVPPGSAPLTFKTIQTPAGTSPVADSATDTLTLASTDFDITGNSATDTVTMDMKAKHKTVSLETCINGNGGVITTGIVPGADLKIPWAMTVTEWHVLGAEVGSIVIDVWRSTYAAYPPVVGDTFTAAAKPTLSGVAKNQNTSPTWGNSNVINAGDILRFNVDSVTTCTSVVLVIVGTRT